MRNVCTVDNCNTVVKGLGFCGKHYQQFKTHGKTFVSGGKEFNEVVHKKNHCELIITNKDMEEICRAKIDKQDLDKVRIVGRWGLTVEGYVCNTKTGILMHRHITGVTDKKDVDHIKTGKQFRTDNRKKNLRVATRSQNMFNTVKHKDNMSGYKGVTKKV